MKRGGSIFPERIDSYSQLPLLQENSIHAIACNSLRSAILRVEETIGEKILDSKIFGKLTSIKDRLNLIELRLKNSNNIDILEYNYQNYTILELTQDGWLKKNLEVEPKQIGIVLDGLLLTGGTFWIEDNNSLKIGSRITILDEKIVQSDDVLYIGTIVAKNNNLAQILIRNTW